MADDPRDRSRAYVAAGVSFFDDADRILLVQPTYRDYWDIPGGYVETGETPAQAAAREVREELGMESDYARLRSLVGIEGGGGRTTEVRTTQCPQRNAEPGHPPVVLSTCCKQGSTAAIRGTRRRRPSAGQRTSPGR